MKQFSPTQLVLGGCVLAFGASFLNTGFILTTGTSVSHLTGDIARIGSGLAALGSEGVKEVLNVVVATIGFVTGATTSGFLLHHPTLEMKMPYGRILSALGVCLVLSHFAYLRSPLLAIAIASAVCGIQNALASRYRGVVLRTTHLTGLFTDFGIHLGMKLRGHKIERWKILIPVWLTLSFLLGAILSGILLHWGSRHWILAAGVGYCLSGVFWSIYKRTRSSLAEEN
ncbi:YoaK family protein [Roseibacillus persicicus]|uniref:YoaK family protein n=1 Tax=Roseibacillus persicicus TaxID=454148 RepID=UPI00280C4A38|nr:YoaK family protein [Roseibacillus persicicus]MDQ8191506.1 YoaK family protein [Roseibacillus persicicus]